jgi:hypothetical protein
MSERVTGKPPVLPPDSVLVESPGNVTEMGAGHPISAPVARMSGGTGMGASEAALWQRESMRAVQEDAARCRAELQAINRANRERWKR